LLTIWNIIPIGQTINKVERKASHILIGRLKDGALVNIESPAAMNTSDPGIRKISLPVPSPC